MNFRVSIGDKHYFYNLYKNPNWINALSEMGCFDTAKFLKGEYIIQRSTGLFDINNREIFEGDKVVMYQDNHYKEKLADGVYLIDFDKPKTDFKDIIVAKGTIAWNPPFFTMELDKPTENGIVSTMLYYGANYEIV